MTTSPEAKRQLARAGRHLALAMQYLGPEMSNANSPVRSCWDELNLTATALGSAGVVVDVKPERVAPATDSLAALRRIEESRQEGLAFLEQLRALLSTAEALDKARGDWVGDAAHIDQGETPGTNYAEAVQELALRITAELGIGMGSGHE